MPVQQLFVWLLAAPCAHVSALAITAASSGSSGLRLKCIGERAASRPDADRRQSCGLARYRGPECSAPRLLHRQARGRRLGFFGSLARLQRTRLRQSRPPARHRRLARRDPGAAQGRRHTGAVSRKAHRPTATASCRSGAPSSARAEVPGVIVQPVTHCLWRPSRTCR